MNQILVGDIGGTNARLGVAHFDSTGCISIRDFIKYQGESFPTITDMLETYSSRIDGVPKKVSLAVAGPVENDSAYLTNRSWSISADDVCEMSSFDAARIFNDFAAMARSVPELDHDDFANIHQGTPDKSSPILVAGPGTGFGVSYVIPMASGWKILSTEGGHVAYAPQTQMESEILFILQKGHEFVSLELVSAGIGLASVHKAVCELHGVDYSYLEPSDIQENAMTGDAVCRDVFQIRANATMSALGDFVLSGGARGGVVIAGGVAQHMAEIYKQPEAMSRFFKKGKYESYLRETPIRLMKKATAPLIGAAALYKDNS